MAGHPYWYFVRYEQDVQAALEKLRQREFAAGRYNPAMPFIEFPVDPSAQSPGAQHASIEDALNDSAEDGTRSILDIQGVAETADFCMAAPLAEDALEELFETTQPTHEMVQGNLDLFERIERGQAVYFVVYKDGEPEELFFAGYSFD